MATHAARQLGLTFTQDDVELYESLETLCETTGMSKSEAVRACLRAVLEGDEDELERMQALVEASNELGQCVLLEHPGEHQERLHGLGPAG